MKFPDSWPNDCPPSTAIDAAGEVFRVVKHNPPQADDFLSHQETGRLPLAPACLRCGLSVFRQSDDADHLRRLFPKIGRWIAVGRLQPADGKTQLTSGNRPTHTTWWAYEGVDRATAFTVIPEEGA